MIFINPQWQGSGLTDEIRIGVENLKVNYDLVGICITESTVSKLELLRPIWPILDQIEL